MRESHRRTSHAPKAIVAAFVTAAIVLFTLLGTPAQAQIPGSIQASAGGPYAGQIGFPIQFSGSLLSSFGFGVSQFQWSFGDGGVGFGQNTTHAYSAPGTYFVSLTVIDPSGLTATDSTTANVYGGGPGPVPPIGPLSVSPGGPYTGSPGSLITFSGSVSGASFTPFQYTYTWNFGDGFSGSGQTAAHAYSSAGTYTVSLNVVSATGQSGFGSTNAVIRQSLSVSAGTSSFGTAGRPVNFGATVTGGTNPTVTWNFGDGTSGTGQFVSHTYNGAGTYNVTARAVDATGASASDSVTATITQSLILDANGPYSGIAGKPVAVYSTVSGATSPQYRWDFGDGTGATGPNPTHVYANAGNYTLTLYVTDSPSGQSASDTAVATIEPGGPIVSYRAGWNIVAGPAGTIFSQASSSLFTFQANDTTYQVLPPGVPVQGGLGYWAYFTQQNTVTLSGTSADTRTINAPPGQYIMIGNPSASSAVTIKGADTAVSWDAQTSTWKSVSSLAPGAGAWVLVLNGGTVTLSP